MKWRNAMKATNIAAGGIFLFILVGFAFAMQDPNENGYVSREEYNALKKELDELKAEFQAFTQ